MSDNKINDLTPSEMKTFTRGLIFSLVILQLLVSLILDVVRVNEGEVAVITRFGKISGIKEAGWSFKMPYIDSHQATFSSKVQVTTIEADAVTKDQQAVKIKLNVQYRLDTTKADELFKQVRTEDYYEKSILPPILQESVKSQSTNYSSLELTTMRDQFKIDITKAIEQRLKTYYSFIVSVNVENIDWSEQYDKAVEQKIITEQQVQTRRQELEKSKIQSEIEITQARGEAEANRLRKESLTPEIIEKMKIEKWDGKLPQVTGSNTIINLK